MYEGVKLRVLWARSNINDNILLGLLSSYIFKNKKKKIQNETNFLLLNFHSQNSSLNTMLFR